MKWLGWLTAVAIGCGRVAPHGHAPSATAVLPDVPFAQLDREQRAQFMKDRVVPTMKPLFERHDPKKFAAFGCKTCHGPRAERGDHEMPNEALPVLELADMSKHEQADIEWMSTQIKPTMAKLLREPEHSDANPNGFGCLRCHTGNYDIASVAGSLGTTRR
jgi:hypothetical protein